MTPDESAWRDTFLARVAAGWAPEVAARHTDDALAELRKRRDAGVFWPQGEEANAGAGLMLEMLTGTALECGRLRRERAVLTRDRDNAISAGEHLARERDEAQVRAGAAASGMEHWKAQADEQRARAEALKVRVSELEQARDYYGKNCRAAETRAEAAEDALDLERRTRTAEYDGRRRAESFLKEALGALGGLLAQLDAMGYRHSEAEERGAGVLAKVKAAGYGVEP